MKLVKLKDKYIKLYSLRKGNKRICQIEDCGHYIRIYPIYYSFYRCDEEMISIDLTKKAKK